MRGKARGLPGGGEVACSQALPPAQAQEVCGPTQGLLSLWPVVLRAGGPKQHLGVGVSDAESRGRTKPAWPRPHRLRTLTPEPWPPSLAGQEAGSRGSCPLPTLGLRRTRVQVPTPAGYPQEPPLGRKQGTTAPESLSWVNCHQIHRGPRDSKNAAPVQSGLKSPLPRPQRTPGPDNGAGTLPTLAPLAACPRLPSRPLPRGVYLLMHENAFPWSIAIAGSRTRNTI